MSNIYAMTDTWNAAGTTFTAIQMNVTDTASQAGSLLMDLQVGGVSKAKVDKSGGIFATQRSNYADIKLGFIGTSTGLVGGTQRLGLLAGGAEVVLVAQDLACVQLDGSYAISWVTGFPSQQGADLYLIHEAAGVLGQHNGAGGANAKRVYNTRTNSSNYERMSMDWKTTANVARLMTEAAGTGTKRLLAIDGFSKAGAAVAADIPSGSFALVKDTSGGTTKLIYNDGGTLQSVTLS